MGQGVCMKRTTITVKASKDGHVTWRPARAARTSDEITIKVNKDGYVTWGRRIGLDCRRLGGGISDALCTPGTYKLTRLRSGGSPLLLTARDPWSLYPVCHRPWGTTFFCADFARFVGFQVTTTSDGWKVDPAQLVVHLRITFVKPL